MNHAQMRPHTGWIFATLFAALTLFSVSPLASAIESSLSEKLTTARMERDKLAAQIKQWKDDAHTAQELSRTITTSELDHLLLAYPQHKMAEQVESIGAASRLANMVYLIEPPAPWEGDGAFSGITGIKRSILNVEADTPHDGDIVAFLRNFKPDPARITLLELNIDRLENSVGKTPSAINLHMKARYEWLANADNMK